MNCIAIFLYVSLLLVKVDPQEIAVKVVLFRKMRTPKALLSDKLTTRQLKEVKSSLFKRNYLTIK